MKNFFTQIKNFVNRSLFKFGYRISKINNTGELVKIHKYKNYEEYKKTQIYFNKEKLNKVWADEDTLKIISNFIKENIKSDSIKGICHGSRNGFEQKYLNNQINKSDIFGTDISDSAINFENSVVHDFHEIREEWKNNFDFIYSNSLDQSYDPRKALTVWLDQLKKDSYLIIEHSDQHGVIASSHMDPFGVEANFFPYLMTEWFGHKISIKIIKSTKSNKNNAPVFLFIIKKNY